MGFYDKKVKQLYESCPRLVILSVNNIFGKAHAEDAIVTYLDKEQVEGNETFMDMLVQIEECKYHFEFQMLEDNMAVRMYEYSVKETIRAIYHESNIREISKYVLDVVMPPQAVIFLSGTNKQNAITVNLTLPDGQGVGYVIPCISASMSIENLIENSLFILIPFQQVQLNKKLNEITNRSEVTKRKLALEIYKYHSDVKNSLDKLYLDGKILIDEQQSLIEILWDVEEYLTMKDEFIKKEVHDMGDNDYISISDRVRMEGKEQGRVDILISLICKKLSKNMSIEDIADTIEEPIEFVEKVYEISKKYAPNYDMEKIVEEYRAEAINNG